MSQETRKYSNEDWTNRTVICMDDKESNGLVKGQQYPVARNIFSDIEIEINGRMHLYMKERFKLVNT